MKAENVCSSRPRFANSNMVTITFVVGCRGGAAISLLWVSLSSCVEIEYTPRYGLGVRHQMAVGRGEINM